MFPFLIGSQRLAESGPLTPRRVGGDQHPEEAFYGGGSGYYCFLFRQIHSGGHGQELAVRCGVRCKSGGRLSIVCGCRELLA